MSSPTTSKISEDYTYYERYSNILTGFNAISKFDKIYTIRKIIDTFPY